MTVVNKLPLSSFSPVEYTFDLKGCVSDNNIKNFENGLSINDSSFLKDVVSTTDKSNTKFYIKDFDFFENSFKIQNNKFLSTVIITPLSIDGRYLNFKSFDTDFFALTGDYESYLNIGKAVLSPTKNFISVSLSSGNLATIYIEKDGSIFNLKTFSDGSCLFFSTQAPTIFNYLYSTERKQLTFSTKIGNTTLFLTQKGEDLFASPLSGGNKTQYLHNGFDISKQIVTTNDYPKNSFVNDYNLDLSVNNIEKNKGNFLMHRTDNDISIISLKNILNQNGTFSSTVNGLSSSSKFKVSSIRKYTSINSDISRLNDNELSMNYVFGNQEYLITPGKNVIQTPENMYPFNKINVNDTTFTKCGAYPHTSPVFSDVIYKYDHNTIINNQHLLCTWLSGNSSNSIWVDRYYYPDLISKEDALASNPIFNSTYENEIENLISTNIDLENSIVKQLYFDKISDLCFSADEYYVYDRINTDRFEALSSVTYDPCTIELNYFKNINKEGAFELSFYFDGNTDVWQLSSKRNDIDGGFKFVKNPDNIDISLSLYDPSTMTFENFNVNTSFESYSINFFGMSIDAVNGVGYFYINDNVIKMFSFKKAQYINKNILFGDFVFPNNLSRVRICPEYRPSNDISIYPIIDSVNSIDNITISLPSGTRNSMDILEIIQNVCDSSSYKSNVIDIFVKNLDLNSDDLNNLKEGIRKNAIKNMPITATIRNIETSI